MGSDSHHAPEAWCSRKGTPQAQRAEDWCSQTGILQTQTSKATSDRLAPSGVNHFLGAVRADFCVFSADEHRESEARNRGLGFASCSRGLVFPQGGTTGPKCRGLVFPDGDIAGSKFRHGF